MPIDHRVTDSAYSSEAAYTGTLAQRLVLASASPRRRELLAFLGFPFEIAVSDAEERNDPVPEEVLAQLPDFPLATAQHPTLLAWRKVQDSAQQHPDAVVLGADTIVVLDQDVLNKPRNPEHAQEMLARLSGRTHTVYTGLCIMEPETGASTRKLHVDLIASQVTVSLLSSTDIEQYVATGEPLDKAGAYGIQGLGGRLVRQVEGSYTAVVGLPLPATARLLAAAGITTLNDPTQAYHEWLSSQGKEPLPCPPAQP